MDLKYVKIAGYKNLINTEVVFNHRQTPITIIGNNGTGKSNLIEALLHIFTGLFYGNAPDFEFHLKYTAHTKHVEIINTCENGLSITVDGVAWSKSKFKNRARHPSLNPPFPAQVFSYYSGTCDRVQQLVKIYNRSYMHKLRSQSDDLERQFIFSDVDQAEWILLSLVAHKHKEVLDELYIGKLGDIKLTLQPPDTFTKERDDPSYWGTTGAIRSFIADLHNVARDTYQPYEGMVYPGMRERRTYSIDRKGLEQLGDVLDRRGTTLYSMLQGLHAKDILLDSEFELSKLDSEESYSTDLLSEGEKQLICVIGGLTLSQSNECLILLDEPDTHLNPVWSWKYDSLLQNALNETQISTSTVFLATHDPILISGFEKEQVLIADTPGGALTYSHPTEAPQGLGVGGILTSDMFGLMTTLDQKTSEIIARRRALLEVEDPSDEELKLLNNLNEELDQLGYNFVHPDEDYRQFLITRKQVLTRMQREGVSTVDQRMELIKNILADKGYDI